MLPAGIVAISFAFAKFVGVCYKFRVINFVSVFIGV
nr:MAG TPA: hypothetical protein [Caudoviricetes sp.]